MKIHLIKASPSNFDKAVEKTKELFNKSGDKEVILSLSGGEYNLESSLSLNANDFSGKCALRVIGTSRIKPRFTSLRQIPSSEFVKVEGKPYYKFTFPKDNNDEYPQLRTLYVNGKIAKLSKSNRYTTSDFFETKTKNYSRDDAKPPIFNVTHKLYVPINAIYEVGEDNCIGAEFHIRVEWEFKIFHIERIDVSDTYTNENGITYCALYVDENETDGGNPTLTRCNRTFTICNTVSSIKAGEYSYDQKNGELFYYPKDDINKCKISIGSITNLFDITGFDGVHLENLVFTGIEDSMIIDTGYYAGGQAGYWTSKFEEHGIPQIGALKALNVSNFTIDNCTFENLPCDAISMVGNLNNVSIKNSRFVNIGSSAIKIGKTTDRGGMPKHNAYSHNKDVLYVKDIFIENNYIDNTGFVYENACGIILTKADRARINHNTILNSSYTAISVGWKWNKAEWNYGESVNLDNVEIAYNKIKGYLLNMKDGGAIYTLGGNAEKSHTTFMNTVHDNYLIADENTSPENGLCPLIYHDGASSNWYTANNVVVRNPEKKRCRGVFFQRGWNKAFKFGVASTEEQATWNILCDNNYMCLFNNRDEAYQDPQAIYDFVDVTRNLFERNTHYVPTEKDLLKCNESSLIIKYSGCSENIIKK